MRTLYHVQATYKTPSGHIAVVHMHRRAESLEELHIACKVELCADGKRKVARGVDGITLKIYGEQE